MVMPILFNGITITIVRNYVSHVVHGLFTTGNCRLLYALGKTPAFQDARSDTQQIDLSPYE
jgi:hypothetical protein